jgi:hypothetical protein
LPHLLSAEPGIPFLKDAEREGEKTISPNQFTLLLRGWRDALFTRGRRGKSISPNQFTLYFVDGGMRYLLEVLCYTWNLIVHF